MFLRAEEASILMDRSPGGWNDLVTNQVLGARLDTLTYELVATMERGFWVRTWRLLGAMSMMFGVFATLVRVTEASGAKGQERARGLPG